MGAAGPLIMLSFVTPFALAYVATTLLAGAVGHAARLGSFHDLIREHAIIPPRGAPLAALLTLLAEPVGGTAAIVLLLRQSDAAATLLLFAATGGLGVGFHLYIRRLLGQPHTTSGCGCTPLSSPLTPASLLPSAALVMVSAAGLATALVSDWTPVAAPGSGGSLSLLAPLWGMTVAVLVMLAPASMPSAPIDSGR